MQYEICIKENPKESAPFYELSKICLNKEFNKAKALWTLKTLRRKYLVFILLIEIYNQTGEFENQAKVWEDLIKIKPENKLYHFEAYTPI